MDDDVFYRPLGGARYRPTLCAQGPWDAAHQYGGAVAALLAHHAEQLPPPGFQPIRSTCDFLGPVPMDTVSVTTRVGRQGRSLWLVEAELAAGADGTPRARFAGWWSRAAPLDLPPTGAAADTAEVSPVPPAEPHPRPPFGYLRASERRFVKGEFLAPGPAFAWMRTHVPLTSDAPGSALSGVLMNADMGSGISAVVDWTRFAFANVDLTVHLHRQPVGSWTGLDAVTELGADGAGSTRAVLWDETGPIGTAAQALFVRAR
ncbi:thioesterase family protein [Streptomyces sp. NPDC094032]|uniref:thioesterase family protein n=1 Tax=Streptomyces sp. NPDC094032 TaxID=3155308 RepID=UPI003323E4AE